jgi:N-acetylmuramoyl-L-alanine amidase
MRPGTAILLLLLALLAPLEASAAGEVPLVAVDAGHTAAAPGAIGARGTRERDLNLAVAARLAEALEAAGIHAVQVGSDDLDPAARAALAARLGASALVSVHHDSVQPRYLETWRVDGAERLFSDRFAGFSVFFSGAGARPAESLALARAVGAALVALGLGPTLHHAEAIPGEGGRSSTRGSGSTGTTSWRCCGGPRCRRCSSSAE